MTGVTLVAALGAEEMTNGCPPGVTPRSAAVPRLSKAAVILRAVVSSRPPCNRMLVGTELVEPIADATTFATVVRRAVPEDGGKALMEFAPDEEEVDGVATCRRIDMAAREEAMVDASKEPGCAVREARALAARLRVASSRTPLPLPSGSLEDADGEIMPRPTTVTFRPAALARLSAAVCKVAESEAIVSPFALMSASSPGIRINSEDRVATDELTRDAAYAAARMAPCGFVTGEEGPFELGATCRAVAEASSDRDAGSAPPAAARGDATLAFAAAMPMPPS